MMTSNVTIPRELLLTLVAAKLTRDEMAIMLTLIDQITLDGGVARISHAMLCEVAGIASPPSVSKCVKSLESKGLISREVTHNAPTAYRLKIGVVQDDNTLLCDDITPCYVTTQHPVMQTHNTDDAPIYSTSITHIDYKGLSNDCTSNPRVPKITASPCSTLSNDCTSSDTVPKITASAAASEKFNYDYNSSGCCRKEVVAMSVDMSDGCPVHYFNNPETDVYDCFRKYFGREPKNPEMLGIRSLRKQHGNDAVIELIKRASARGVLTWRKAVEWVLPEIKAEAHERERRNQPDPFEEKYKAVWETVERLRIEDAKKRQQAC